MLELHEVVEEEEEVGICGMEFLDNISFPFHLMSLPGSTSWKIHQFWEPGELSFDCSSLPSTPLEQLTLWTHSWTPPHHQESGTIKCADRAQAFEAQLQEDDVAGGGLPMKDWRFKLLPDSRQRIANKIVVTLRKHLPASGQEVLLELRKIAVRFEEKMFTVATSQSDYLRKISLKMLTMETKSQNPVCGETVQVVDESLIAQLDAKSPQEDSALHNLQSREECALLEPFLEQPVAEHGNLKRKGDTGPSGQDHTIFEEGNKQKMDKKLKKTWGIGGSISLDDLKQHFGKTREEAAESLDVSISTLKRICRENGISRWPSKTIKRDRLFLSNLSRNKTVSVAAGARISISTTPTAFASTKVLVNSNQQKSWISNTSLDNEIGTSLNDDVLRNDEGTDGENIMIQEGTSAHQEVLYKPQELEPGHDSLIPAYPLPDAPTILSPLPQETVPAIPAYPMPDAPTILTPLPQETVPAKYSPGQQGEKIARQIEMADGTSHLEKQYLGRERLCSNTEKEVIVSVEESSSYEYDFRNVLEPNQDHLADFASLDEVNKDQLISMDNLKSDCIMVQSTIESKSEPSLQNDARRMKMIFERLIMLPLEDLTSPYHEASMKEALTVLAGNLSLFADEQAKQLLELKFDFPTITYSWLDCSQSRTDCRNFLAEFENTKSLLETSILEGDYLKHRYTQIECKEKEMMAQLEAIQTKKNEISKQKSENFLQTKQLAALEEEQASKTKEKELQMTIASAKLDKLKSQWVSVQSSFN